MFITLHKNHFCPWMIYSSCVFSWVQGFIMNTFLFPLTSNVVDGQCMSNVIWKTRAGQFVFGFYYFICYYLLIVVIFAYCYARILAVIRRQNRVFPGHNPAHDSNAAAIHESAARRRANVIRTMIFVSAFFAVSWFPNCVTESRRDTGGVTALFRTHGKISGMFGIVS
jgi:hypothetical protein